MFSFFLLACCFQVVTTFLKPSVHHTVSFNIHLLLHHSSLSRQRREQRLCKFECTFLLFNTSEIIQSFLTAAQESSTFPHIFLFSWDLSSWQVSKCSNFCVALISMPERKLQMNNSTVGTFDNGIISADKFSQILKGTYSQASGKNYAPYKLVIF